MRLNEKDKEIVRGLREAARETAGLDREHYFCKDCKSLYGPSVHEITKGHCADCFLEINYGIFPKQRVNYRGSLART